jgi:hypothetical protein
MRNKNLCLHQKDPLARWFDFLPSEFCFRMEKIPGQQLQQSPCGLQAPASIFGPLISALVFVADA